MNAFQANFHDPERVARYIDNGPPAFVPGHAGMLQMTGVLLAERVPEDASVLVVGVGGGLETRYLAQFAPSWRFTGVDPAPAMLDLARAVAGPFAGERLTLIEGTIADAPSGPFDAATCILVLGVISDNGEKLATLEGIHQRLKRGAPLILVDQCIDPSATDRSLRLDRYAAYALASEIDPDVVIEARGAIEANTTMVAPSRNEHLLAQARFNDVEVFYVGLAWRGWLAYA